MTELFLDIRNYGAISDGVTDCTQAFKKAAEICKMQGGGTIFVPHGKFLTYSIELYSNTTLHFDSGSELLFQTQIENYEICNSRWEGESRLVYKPLIFADNAKNVTVKGRGILNGNGEVWWNTHLGRDLKYPRPRFICFQNSENILIEDITLINSPAWTINPILSENITITKVTINNHPKSPNTDGINPESCNNVRISDCHIDVGDDCITLKSGIEDCNEFVPLTNVTITNCTMNHGHGGVVIGSEMSGGVKNVVVSNCVFNNTDRGIRIKTRRGRGGIVENLIFSNIVMQNVMCPFVINMYYYCGKNGDLPKVADPMPYPVDKTTPIIKNIYYNNIIAVETESCAGYIYGLSEMPITDVFFNNITVKMKENGKFDKPAMHKDCESMSQRGFIARNTSNLVLNNFNITGQKGDAFSIDNISLCDK